MRASLARVWENVLDWEHLPWLHRDTFADVTLLASGAWGWRAAVRLREAATDEPPLTLEVRVDRAAGTYHTRTLAGAGEGTDVRTRLEPAGADVTRVTVDFDVPAVPPGRASRVGASWVALYTRLWDEDEGMMRARQAVLDGRAPAAPRTVALDGCVYRFRPVCPHRGGPLAAATPDATGCLTCPWHGYRFDVRTGRSADGRGMLLDAWEVG